MSRGAFKSRLSGSHDELGYVNHWWDSRHSALRENTRISQDHDIPISTHPLRSHCGWPSRSWTFDLSKPPSVLLISSPCFLFSTSHVFYHFVLNGTTKPSQRHGVGSALLMGWMPHWQPQQVICTNLTANEPFVCIQLTQCASHRWCNLAFVWLWMRSKRNSTINLCRGLLIMEPSRGCCSPYPSTALVYQLPLGTATRWLPPHVRTNVRDPFSAEPPVLIDSEQWQWSPAAFFDGYDHVTTLKGCWGMRSCKVSQAFPI